ncbi:hypothetical protein [Streptomyces buecherae]
MTRTGPPHGAHGPPLFDFGLTVTAREHRVWLGDPARGWPLARA